MEKALGRIFRAVKKRLPDDLKAAGFREVQHLGQKSLADDEAFWAAQRETFFGTLKGEQEALLLQGVSRATRLGVAVNFDLVNEEVLRFAAIYNDKWWDKLQQTTRNGLRDAITKNIESGAPMRSLVKDIEPLFGKARAEGIATTETTRLYAEGNLMAYRADPAVEKAEWLTAMDARVCDICEPLAGQVFDKQDVPPQPAHVRCRCDLAPITATGGV